MIKPMKCSENINVLGHMIGSKKCKPKEERKKIIIKWL